MIEMAVFDGNHFAIHTIAFVLTRLLGNVDTRLLTRQKLDVQAMAILAGPIEAVQRKTLER